MRRVALLGLLLLLASPLLADGQESQVKGSLPGSLPITITITITVTPAPAPAPVPPPGGKVDPPPSAGPLYLVVIGTATGAAERGQLYADPALQSYLKIKGHHVRLVDENVVGPDGKPPADVAPYLARAQGKALPQLFLVDQAGHVLYAGPLPTTAPGIIALLKSRGG